MRTAAFSAKICVWPSSRRLSTSQGKTQQFRDAFERINGGAWVESRDAYSYYRDDIVEVLQQVLGWSEQAASSWFDGEEDDRYRH